MLVVDGGSGDDEANDGHGDHDDVVIMMMG